MCSFPCCMLLCHVHIPREDNNGLGMESTWHVINGISQEDVSWIDDNISVYRWCAIFLNNKKSYFIASCNRRFVISDPLIWTTFMQHLTYHSHCLWSDRKSSCNCKFLAKCKCSSSPSKKFLGRFAMEAKENLRAPTLIARSININTKFF